MDFFLELHTGAEKVNSKAGKYVVLHAMDFFLELHTGAEKVNSKASKYVVLHAMDFFSVTAHWG